VKRSRASSCKVCLSLPSPSFPHPPPPCVCLVQIPSPQPLASTSSGTLPLLEGSPLLHTALAATVVVMVIVLSPSPILASLFPSLPTRSRLAPFASMFLKFLTSVSMSSAQDCSDGEREEKEEQAGGREGMKGNKK
jgi:hypothetical protein